MIKHFFKKLKGAARQRFGVKPLSDTVPNLEAWYKGPLGQALLKEEQKEIDQVVNYLFGYHLLQLSVAPSLNLSQNSTINHRFGFTPVIDNLFAELDINALDCTGSEGANAQAANQQVLHDPIVKAHVSEEQQATNEQVSKGQVSKGQVSKEKVSKDDDPEKISSKTGIEPISNSIADPERIPLCAESIDVAILHHVLDFTQNPHHLLRETARVLIPRGYAIIVGFNPISSFGLCKTFARIFSRQPQWCHHSLRLGRIVDWLRLLDFEPVEIHHGYYRLPLNNQRFIDKTHWYERLMKKMRLPCGGFYLILARKDVVAMTPIKPVWKKFNPIEGLVGSKGSPTARGSPGVSTVNKTTFNKATLNKATVSKRAATGNDKKQIKKELNDGVLH